MFGLVDIALAAGLAACGYALWVRRHTWGSQWDANPSRVLVFMVCAGLLISPWGSTRFDPLVHRVFGLWNVAGLLAVLCMFCAVAVMFEHLASRLTDDDQARLLGRRHLTAPLKFVLPLVILAFCVADRGHPEYLDVFAPRGPWFGVYWALIAIGGRVVPGLGRFQRRGGSAVTLPTWICAGVSAIAFACASALSWRARADWFSPFRPTAPETAGD